jgi:hypothetical protein
MLYTPQLMWGKCRRDSEAGFFWVNKFREILMSERFRSWIFLGKQIMFGVRRDSEAGFNYVWVNKFREILRQRECITRLIFIEKLE